jgi:hypothetical protein
VPGDGTFGPALGHELEFGKPRGRRRQIHVTGSLGVNDDAVPLVEAGVGRQEEIISIAGATTRQCCQHH